MIALAGLTVCFLFGVLRARAADPTEELAAALDRIDHLKGRFEQRQFDESGQLLQESSGSFRLLRPGYFAWEIEVPDSQLVIADPEYIWHHDRDLETVTRRPVSGSVDASPLQVLGGDETVLRKQFTVTRPEPGRYVLVDTSGEASFSELTLHLQGNTILGMQIMNKLNQRVEVDFHEVDSDTPLTPGDFVFQPPPGADLFYYDQ
jgi:outer membrane lipoprotein carrier protein